MSLPIRRIAVIGGGPLGIETAKYLLAEQCFTTIDIYEQQARAGGAWYYTDLSSSQYFAVPQTNPYQPPAEPVWTTTKSERHPVFMTPMYDVLETNIPKELMEFPDLPFSSDLPLFPDRRDVLAYLEHHAAEVRHLIRFETQVTEVKLLEQGADKWRLTSKDLQTEQQTTQDYDAIAVCSGHYYVPQIPPSTGIERWHSHYPNSISHSKWYRSPKVYTGKKVLVIGNGASGTDIAKQIGSVSQHPVLTSQRSRSIFVTPDDAAKETRIKAVPEIAEFIDPDTEHRAVRFTDGYVEKNIDAILFATGYLYSFPFLPCKQLDLLGDGTRVQHIYQHVFHMKHPSLAFLGLPVKILPFPVGETQAAVVARLWAGRVNLPSQAEMQKWEEARIQKHGSGKKFHTLDFPQDVDYQHEMYDWASKADQSIGKMPMRFDNKVSYARERFPSIRGAFLERGSQRKSVRTIEELGFNYEEWLKEQGPKTNGSK